MPASLRDNPVLVAAFDAWLRGNGIDPARVPVDAMMAYGDGVLFTEMIVDCGGRPMLDPVTGTAARTVERFPVTPPAGLVATWFELIPRGTVGPRPHRPAG